MAKYENAMHSRYIWKILPCDENIVKTLLRKFRSELSNIGTLLIAPISAFQILYSNYKLNPKRS